MGEDLLAELRAQSFVHQSLVRRASCVEEVVFLAVGSPARICRRSRSDERSFQILRGDRFRITGN